MPEKAAIETLVIESVGHLAEDFEIDTLKAPTSSSPLYGSGGPLDSMALVNLIADLEEDVSRKFGNAISLADEKAMSAKCSPFQSVETLTEAIMERLPS